MKKVKELELSVKIDCLKELIVRLMAPQVMYMCNDLKYIVAVRTKIPYKDLDDIDSYFPEFTTMVNEGGREIEGDEYTDGTAWIIPWDLPENQFKINKLQDLINKLQ